MSDKILKIYTDGGARGNPGPAAAAFAAVLNSRKVKEFSKYLGETTNNVAEYSAVLIAVEWLLNEEQIYQSVEFFIDSELVVKQLNGLYKVKNDRLKNYVNLIYKKLEKIKIPVKFIHVKREKNSWADSLVNKELDENMR